MLALLFKTLTAADEGDEFKARVNTIHIAILARTTSGTRRNLSCKNGNQAGMNQSGSSEKDVKSLANRVARAARRPEVMESVKLVLVLHVRQAVVPPIVPNAPAVVATPAKTPSFTWAPTQNVPAVGVPEWTSYFANAGGSLPVPASDITKCTGPTSNVWGASFDDGPSNETQTVLNYFKSVNMHTTFWVIGGNVMDFPQVLLQTYQAGHQIGIHTWSHPSLLNMTDDQIVAEFVYCARAIYEVIGVVPKFYRPPFGDIDPRVRKVAASMGLTSVTWEADTDDWNYVGKNNMTQVPLAFQTWLAANLTLPISLEHDLYAETVAVVQESMDLLIKAGRVIAPLSECIGDSTPYGNTILETFLKSGQFELYNPVAAAATAGGSSVAVAVSVLGLGV
ncbi:chitin deacetylase [Podochytrium sp. JEL0797]|nr:chitin deacetylase [Podochytrium sp. JEL0797]